MSSTKVTFETLFPLNSENLVDDDIDKICNLWGKAKHELRKKLKHNVRLQTELNELKLQLRQSEKSRKKSDEQAIKAYAKLAKTENSNEGTLDMKKDLEKEERKNSKLTQQNRSFKDELSRMKQENLELRKDQQVLKKDTKLLNESLSQMRCKESILFNTEEKLKTSIKNCERLKVLLSKTKEFKSFSEQISVSEDDSTQDAFVNVDEVFHWIPGNVLQQFNECSSSLGNSKFSSVLKVFLKTINTLYRERELNIKDIERKKYEKMLKTQTRRKQQTRTYSSVVNENRLSSMKRSARSQRVKVNTDENIGNILNKYLRPLNNYGSRLKCTGMNKNQVNLLDCIKECLIALDKVS